MSSHVVITDGPPRRRRGAGPVMATIGAVLIVTLAGTTGFLLWDRYRSHDGAGPIAPTEADLALVAELSPLTFDDCTPARPDVKGVTAAVSCSLTGTDVATVLVLRFALRSDMDDYMEPDYQVVAIGECNRGRWAGSWSVEDESDIRGDVNCWETGAGSADAAHISVSVYSTNIVVVASGTNLDDMYDWWRLALFPDHG